MKMEYTPIPLVTVFDVDAIVNISYYKLENGYVFSGESHFFWEFIYVDRGSIVVTAGADKYFLKAGELAFHCPYEFHSFQSVGASDVMVVAFCCESEAMHRLEKKVLLLHQREKQCLKPLMDEAQQAYQYFENDPALVNLRKKPTAPWGSDQLIKLYLEQLFICICRRDDNVRFSQRAITSTQFHQHLLLAQQARLSCRALFRGHHASIAGRGARHKRLTAQARVPRADRPEHGALSHGAAHRRGKASDPRGKPHVHTDRRAHRH